MCRAPLALAMSIDGREPDGIFNSFVALFTATPWGYTNKLFGVEMLLGWEGAEIAPEDI